MESKMKAFLQPPVIGKTKEVVISNRFTDEKGNVVPFVIKSISQAENEEISRQCTTVRPGKGGREVRRVNNILYGRKMVLACTVEPNFNDAEVCKFYGVVDPTEVPGIMLTIGEYNTLMEKIMEINGIKTGDELVEEAKNS